MIKAVDWKSTSAITTSCLYSTRPDPVQEIHPQYLLIKGKIEKMSPPIRLTFGVELEFLLAYFPDPCPPDICARKAAGDWSTPDQFQYDLDEQWVQRGKVRDALQTAGLEVNPHLKYGFNKWTVTMDGSVLPQASDLANMNPTWANGQTENLTRKEFNEIRYMSCEVISPILS